jgi:hypothetical protein
VALYDKSGNLVEDVAAMAALLSFNIDSKPSKNSEMKKLAVFATLFGLATDALTSEDQLFEQVTKLKADHDAAKARITELENQQKADHAAKIKLMLDEAEAAKKITKEQRPNFEKIANLSYEDCKVALEAIKPTILPMGLVGGPEGAAAKNEDRSKWTLAMWHKNDYKGLMAMKESDPDRYNNLPRN